MKSYMRHRPSKFPFIMAMEIIFVSDEVRVHAKMPQ